MAEISRICPRFSGFSRERSEIALNLAFSCSLRMGEMLGLTWDCCDISKESIEINQAHIYVNKELQRVTKDAVRELDAKDVLLVFPEKSKKNTTVRVLKTPKTDSSVTYKLKLNGGDIKAVQGGSGRSGCRTACKGSFQSRDGGTAIFTYEDDEVKK